MKMDICEKKVKLENMLDLYLDDVIPKEPERIPEMLKVYKVWVNVLDEFIKKSDDPFFSNQLNDFDVRFRKAIISYVNPIKDINSMDKYNPILDNLKYFNDDLREEVLFKLIDYYQKVIDKNRRYKEWIVNRIKKQIKEHVPKDLRKSLYNFLSE